MSSRSDLAQFVTDAASNPKASAAVSAATSGIGLSTYIGFFENGVGIAASGAGLILAVMMIRKVMLENKKLRIEIERLSSDD